MKKALQILFIASVAVASSAAVSHFLYGRVGVQALVAGGVAGLIAGLSTVNKSQAK